MKLYLIPLITSILLGCSSPSAEMSDFENLDITVGMERKLVEEKVADLKGESNEYSAYANNLYGGQVQYDHDGWILEVVYKAGAPAPTILREDGTTQGYPPIDETVESFKIIQPQPEP